MGKASRMAEAGLERASLVLVDDDPLISESLAFVLRDAFVVHEVASRAEARTLLQGADPMPMLALVDLGLPPEPHSPDEGFALIDELLTMNPRMKVLVLSGHCAARSAQRAPAPSCAGSS